jgi:hypothetical protein
VARTQGYIILQTLKVAAIPIQIAMTTIQSTTEFHRKMGFGFGSGTV